MGCTFNSKWNGYYCPKDNEIANVIFESLDIDALERTFSPIRVTTSNFPSYSNVLNSFADKAYTLYGGQLRRTRFPFTIRTGRGVKYNITYTGTVPKKQRFRLNALDGFGIVLSIKYSE